MRPFAVIGLTTLGLYLLTRSKNVAAVVLPTPEVDSVPLTIVKQCIASQDPDKAKRQSVWLNDQGFIVTAAALNRFASGDLDADTLLQIAKTGK